MENLRFAIALSGLSSKRFETLLNKLIVEELILSDEKYLKAHDFQTKFKYRYDLDFGIEEIERAAKFDRTNLNVISENNILVISLSEKGKTLKSREKYNFTQTVNDFIKVNGDLFVDTKISNRNACVEKILTNFLYELFKSGKEEILELLQGDKPSTKLEKSTISTQDRAIINKFLEWDNPKKDEFVFDITKSAYDYCLLSLKIEPNQTIFSRKHIYLDTNVIFSLNGINGKEKQDSAKLFLGKCKELSSEVLYTSKTKIECIDTIEKLVDNMSSIIRKDTYLTCEEMRRIFHSSNPAALYELYVSWQGGHPERNGDYEGFKKFLKIELEKTLSELAFDQINKSFLDKNSQEIENYSRDLLKYKEGMGRRHSENAARLDATNFLYIESQRNKKSSTIQGQNVFFVTFDTGLHRWASKQSEGTVNIFILLTIMYSVMLRFSNRTKDDYRSFNEFISQRLSCDFWDDDVIAMKQSLIKDFQQLDYPDNVKRSMIYYANNQLEELIDAKKDKDIQTDEIVKRAQDYFFEEFDEYKDKIKNEEVKRAQDEYYEKGFSTAVEHRIEEVYRHKIISYYILAVLIAIFFVASISLCLFFVIKDSDSTGTWITGGAAILDLALAMICHVKIKKPERESIREKVYKRWNIKNSK